MGAFLEDPLFLFMDDTEPILPIFRSPEYSDSGRIVELADVGCDTKTSFPKHFSRGVFDRRRGGAESFETIRRIAKRHNERPKHFSARTATIPDNSKSRNANYVGAKKRQNNGNYNDVYIADLDYDSFVEDPYDDFELSKNDFTAGYKDDYYSEYAGTRNIIGCSGKERLSRNVRYDHLRNLKSPFSRSNCMSRECDELVNKRENTYPRWFADSGQKNFHGACNTDFQSRLSPSSKSKKRTKIFSETDKNFNHDEMEFEKDTPERWERTNIFSDATDSIVFPKNAFWNFVSLENEPNGEESTFSDPTRIKSYGRLQRLAPKKRSSRNIDLQQTLANNNNSTKEDLRGTREEKSREDPFPKDRFGNPRYRISKGDDEGVVTDKRKILRSNFLNTNSVRVRSANITNNERLLDIYCTKNATTNTRPRSAFAERKTDINSATFSERKKETTNSTSPRTADDLRYRDKFGNTLAKSFNKSSNETDRLTKASKCVADSKSNERMSAVKKEDNIKCRIAGVKNNKSNRINQVVFSRSAPKEKTENEKTFALKTTPASLRTEMEKKKQSTFSRLPVRTWKRVRTKGPSALRLENDITNEAVNRKFQSVDVAFETMHSSNHPGRTEDVEDPKKTVEDRATRERNNIKGNDRYRTRLVSAAKPRLASANLEDLKGTRGLSTTKGTREQRKERIYPK